MINFHSIISIYKTLQLHCCLYRFVCTQLTNLRNISVRAVASMYSWGGVGQKFPNVEKKFRIFYGIRSHESVCYPENEDAIYKQKYAYFTHRHITEVCSAEGPRKFLNLESLKCHFLDFGGRFDRILVV
jgi:hypothetical protein